MFQLVANRFERRYSNNCFKATKSNITIGIHTMATSKSYHFETKSHFNMIALISQNFELHKLRETIF